MGRRVFSPDEMERARRLYTENFKKSYIVEKVGCCWKTLERWIAVYNWGYREMDRRGNGVIIKKKMTINPLTSGDPLHAAKRRMRMLLHKDDKTKEDYKEIDYLTGCINRLERISRQRSTQAIKEAKALNNPKKLSRKINNNFTELDHEALMEKFRASQYEYQFDLYQHKNNKTRNLLKSRQIGFTRYFAAEAFVDALETANNQIFISASKSQAEVFKDYIRGFAMDWFGRELCGKDKVELITDKGLVTLYFLSSNSMTAQSYNGNFYFDEYFWVRDFEKLNKVAGAMASQKRFRKTYFSTPSAMSHPAYDLWSGERYNERFRKRNQKAEEFPQRKALREGVICPDKTYRKIITINDAIKKGCDLFDLEELEQEYTDDEFNQLFRCQFIDDSNSLFQLSALQNCLSDIVDWRDFNPDRPRPFMNKPVWIGYDPSRTRDGACIVVIAPPKKIGLQYRILERIRMYGQSWFYQSEKIRALTEKYTVDYIGIDTTGPGSGVFEQVQQFFPKAKAIHYTLESKTRLVLKAQEIIDQERILWDASWSDIAAGFMQIRRTTTSSGQITFIADRTERTGHADSAWAIMHALINEGLNSGKSKSSIYAFGLNDE